MATTVFERVQMADGSFCLCEVEYIDGRFGRVVREVGVRRDAAGKEVK